MVAANPPLNANRVLQVLDPNLPSLAAEAAVDIENLLQGTASDWGAITKLGHLLRNSIEFPEQGSSPRSLMDPPTLVMLGAAISAITPLDLRSKISLLLKEAGDIADILSSEEVPQDKNALTRARDFCIALSMAAAAYYDALFETPLHSHRR
ncbi:MAG: hypothetical protein WC712_10395 [Candidatus Brocadiia bacterium]